MKNNTTKIDLIFWISLVSRWSWSKETMNRIKLNLKLSSILISLKYILLYLLIIHLHVLINHHVQTHKVINPSILWVVVVSWKLSLSMCLISLYLPYSLCKLPLFIVKGNKGIIGEVERYVISLSEVVEVILDLLYISKYM